MVHCIMNESIVLISSVIGALAIAVYATWILIYKLRVGRPKSKSIKEWLKNIYEAIWGL